MEVDFVDYGSHLSDLSLFAYDCQSFGFNFKELSAFL